MQTLLSRYAGWSALAYGILILAGLVALILFFSLEFARATSDGAQGKPGFYFFGFLSDVLPAVANAALLVLAFAWDGEAPAAARLWSRLGVACCILAALLNVVAFAGITSRALSVPQQAVVVMVANLPFGIWLLIASRLAGSAGTLPSPLATFGAVCGAALIAGALAFLLLGGLGWYSAPSFNSMFERLPLAITAIVVYLFQFACPIWALLVWRALASQSAGSIAPVASL